MDIESKLNEIERLLALTDENSSIVSSLLAWNDKIYLDIERMLKEVKEEL